MLFMTLQKNQSVFGVGVCGFASAIGVQVAAFISEAGRRLPQFGCRAEIEKDAIHGIEEDQIKQTERA